MTDEELVFQIKAGRTELFEVIVERYKNKMYNLAYKYCRDEEEAQDLAQDIFLTLYKKIHRYRNQAKFVTWFYRVANNKCIDWYRKNSKRSNVNVDYSDEAETYIYEPYNEYETNPEKNYIRNSERKKVYEALMNLPEKYRTPLILFYYQGLSYKDISDVLQMPVKTVQTRLFRGKKKLKSSLCKNGVGGEALWTISV